MKINLFQPYLLCMIYPKTINYIMFRILFGINLIIVINNNVYMKKKIKI